MDLFLADYDTLVNSIIKEFSDTEPIEIYSTKIQYKILDEYYQTIADLFIKYKKKEIAIQLYYKRLFLNEKYFKGSESIGDIYQNISNCHFESDQFEFELAFTAIRNAIDAYSQFLKNQNHDPETLGYVRLQLKNALILEKKIKEELKNFRK